MNSIPQEQNDQHQLEKLAAQRQLYSDAKRIQTISLILSIISVPMWFIIVTIFPQLQIYSAFWGIAVTFLDLLILTPFQKSLQSKAAKIQQLFDSDILKLNWSNLHSGSRPDPETIIEASIKYRKKAPNYLSLQNWYPVGVGQLPLYQARLICQRSNIWWDAQLRRRYSNWVIFLLIVIIIIGFLAGLIGGLTLAKFFLVIVAPLVPIFIFGLRQYIEHNQAAARLDNLREFSENLWGQVINNKISSQDIEKESYSLQTQIYENRRLSPLIFDFIYFKFRRINEEQMNKSAETLIQELPHIP